LVTPPQLDLVTGAFSYSGSHIARRLLDAGHRVRTLSFHPDRRHPLQDSVEALAYQFDDPDELARSLEGVATLYNTYWVRFDHGQTSFEQAIERSRSLFAAAFRAGVARIVHLSITNPSIDSPLPYFRGKALVERALGEAGVPHSIVRPTLIFGGENEVLLNNIAWILRRLPVFTVPGDGAYPVQPVHVEDLARICTEAARAETSVVVDAAGPERISFGELVRSSAAQPTPEGGSDFCGNGATSCEAHTLAGTSPNAGREPGQAKVTLTYTALPTSKAQCKKGGWKNFGINFKNQGQCVSFVVAEQPAIAVPAPAPAPPPPAHECPSGR
jgi:NADH dehydrogenase